MTFKDICYQLADKNITLSSAEVRMLKCLMSGKGAGFYELMQVAIEPTYVYTLASNLNKKFDRAELYIRISSERLQKVRTWRIVEISHDF